MALSNSLRRLEISRGGRGDRGPRPDAPAGLVWSDAGAVVDREGLAEGARVVEDFTITEFREGEPSIATASERVVADPEERGVVYAHDGRAIGTVKRGKRGGHVLEFTWPVGLAAIAPKNASG
jgi:hypothetical protein